MGKIRISRKEFYLNGGFSNTRHFRKMKGGSWHYYKRRGV